MIDGGMATLLDKIHEIANSLPSNGAFNQQARSLFSELTFKFRRETMPRQKTKEALEDRIDERRAENEALQDQLDSIAEIN